jgi:hypothetical protein
MFSVESRLIYLTSKKFDNVKRINDWRSSQKGEMEVEKEKGKKEAILIWSRGDFFLLLYIPYLWFLYIFMYMPDNWFTVES